MNKIKMGATILIVALVCGSIGFLWGKMSAPPKLSRQVQSHAEGPSDAGAIAVQSQSTLLQEILVSVKTMLEQVNTLNDRQVAMGQQINTLKDQQIVLFHQYEDLFADAQQNGGIQPGAPETPEQQAALADDSSVAAQEELQNWIEQQQTIREMPQFQERRLREKLNAMEWTDSLDLDSPPSDG
jgi:hypothetical protein